MALCKLQYYHKFSILCIITSLLFYVQLARVEDLPDGFTSVSFLDKVRAALQK